LLRVGAVGVRGVHDSRRFHCDACNYFFTSAGQTILEAMGFHK